MGISSAKTNNKNIELIFIAILFKVFLNSIAIKNLQICQKLSEAFLPTAKISTARKNDLEEITPGIKAEASTKVWAIKNNKIKKESTKKNRFSLKVNKFTAIKSNNKSKKEAIAENTKIDWKEELVDNFARYLYRLKPVQKELIGKAYKLGAKRTITIISSFKISKQEKKHLRRAVKDNFIKNVKIKFEINNSLHKRIELKDWGYKISWDLRYYLTELEHNQDEVFALGVR